MFYLVHPCDQGKNGGCDQICKENGKEVECACEEGFKLVDGKCEKSELVCGNLGIFIYHIILILKRKHNLKVLYKTNNVQVFEVKTD